MTTALGRIATCTAAAALLCGCSPDRIVSSATSLNASSDPERREILIGTTTRAFLLHLPTKLPGSSAAIPLVIMLHGSGGGAARPPGVTGVSAAPCHGRVILAFARSSPRGF